MAAVNVEELQQLIERDQRCVTVDVQGVSHYYGSGDARVAVLRENRLQIREGEICIMTGPSGSGKTTLLTLIGTLRGVQEGSLRVLDTELYGLSPQKVQALRKRIGFIFQAHNLFAALTASRNVQLATRLAGWDASQADPRIEALLKRLGLEERLHYLPQSLSGGQKQRVAIARGIVHEPPLILADEPTAALDAESGRIVIELFRELAAEQGTTILMVTHDSRVLDAADRIVRLVDGRIDSDVEVKRIELLCQVLQQVPLFAEMNTGLLTEIAEQVELRRYEVGSDIVQEGEPGEEFFILAAGRVGVWTTRDGALTRVNELEPGSFFGEVALLEEKPRNATIRVQDAAICVVLHKAEFQRVMDRSTSFEDRIRLALFERR